MRCRPPITAAAVTVALVVGATGCGEGVVERSVAPTDTTTSESTSGTTGATPSSIPPDSAGLCDELARVAAADREAGQASQDITDWATLQDVIVEASEEAVGLYDAALDLAPPEITEALTEIRDLTAQLADLAREVSSSEEFQRQGQGLSGFEDAMAAVDDLNVFTQRECGFTLADN